MGFNQRVLVLGRTRVCGIGGRVLQEVCLDGRRGPLAWWRCGALPCGGCRGAARSRIVLKSLVAGAAAILSRDVLADDSMYAAGTTMRSPEACSRRQGATCNRLK